MPIEIPDQHYVGEVSQKAVIPRNGKVLVVRDLIDDTWDLPGGRLHKAEDMAEGLRREVLEEIGLEITVGPVIFTDQFVRKRDNIPNVIIAHLCRMDEHTTLTLAKDEIAEAKWIGKEELSGLKMYGVCKKALEAHFQNRDRKSDAHFAEERFKN